MHDKIQVYIKQLEDAKDLKLPEYMTGGAAGVDLYANVKEEVVLAPGEYRLVPTGIAIELPYGYEAQIRGRSGLAAKHGVGLVNGLGTVDADYRGEIKVILINWGNYPFSVQRGDRIAQMVICPVPSVAFVETERLSETDRGAGGFGHTGKK